MLQGLQGYIRARLDTSYVTSSERHWAGNNRCIKIKRPPSCFFRTDARAEPQGRPLTTINHHCPLCCGVNLCPKFKLINEYRYSHSFKVYTTQSLHAASGNFKSRKGLVTTGAPWGLYFQVSFTKLN